MRVTQKQFQIWEEFVPAPGESDYAARHHRGRGLPAIATSNASRRDQRQKQRGRERGTCQLRFQLSVNSIVQAVQSERDINEDAVDKKGRHVAHAAALAGIHVLVDALSVNLV